MAGERKPIPLDVRALLVAAAGAPTFAWLLYAFGMLAYELVGGTVPPVGNLFGMAAFTLLIALWGFPSAALFGAAAMIVAARLRGRMIVRTGLGLVAAGAYVGTSLMLGAVSRTAAFWIAPWSAIVLDPSDFGPPSRAVGVVVCVIVSGAVGGLLYDRIAPRG